MKKVINLVYKTIQITDNSVYYNKQRIAAIISDTVTDVRLRKLLLISIREEIPQKLHAIFSKTLSSNSLEISILKNNFKDDSFLEIDAINTIFDFWINVIWWDEHYLLIPMRDENQKWGFCNEDKEIIIPYQFDYANPFSNGLSVILISQKYGFIDKKGEIVIPTIYRNADNFFDSLARVEIEKDLWAYINLNGSIVIGPYNVSNNYDKELNKLHGGLVRSYNSELKKYGFYNKSNVKVIDYVFDQVSKFSENLALIGEHSKPEGYINKKGEIVKKTNYEEANDFSNGRALIKIDGKYGFIDENFNIVITPIYEYARSFSNGFAAVKKNDLWGFINRNGELIIETKYINSEDFSEERAFVLKESGWGFIDCDGKEYSKFDYFDYNTLGWNMEEFGFFAPDMHIFKDGLAIISRLEDSKDLNFDKESKFGCVNINGDEVIECKYPPIDGHFQNGLAKIGYTYDGGWSYSFFGYMDRFGNTYGFNILDNEDETKDYYDFLDTIYMLNELDELDELD